MVMDMVTQAIHNMAASLAICHLVPTHMVREKAACLFNIHQTRGKARAKEDILMIVLVHRSHQDLFRMLHLGSHWNVFKERRETLGRLG
jgi:hypothetical protein